MRGWAILAILSAAWPAGEALAQSRTDVGELQPPAPRGPRWAAPQVTTAAPRTAAAVQVSGAERTASPPAQLSVGPRDPTLGQLTKEGRSVPAPSQLATGRTAEPPTPLSTPSQGRTANVERVTGEDRCDPRVLARMKPADQRSCTRVIERRSAEFSRPVAPLLSPEERLLVFQEEIAPSADARSAARAFANGGVEDSPAAQGVAAALERRRAEAAERAALGAAPSAAEAFEALVRQNALR